jgi:hypothetical protein
MARGKSLERARESAQLFSRLLLAKSRALDGELAKLGVERVGVRDPAHARAAAHRARARRRARCERDVEATTAAARASASRRLATSRRSVRLYTWILKSYYI